MLFFDPTKVLLATSTSTNQVQVYGILSRIFDGGTSLSVEGRVRPTGRSWQRAGACQLTPCDSCRSRSRRIPHVRHDITIVLCSRPNSTGRLRYSVLFRLLWTISVQYSGKVLSLFCQDSIACIDHSNRHSPWNHRSVFLVNDKVDVLLTETKRKTKSYKNKQRKYKN